VNYSLRLLTLTRLSKRLLSPSKRDTTGSKALVKASPMRSSKLFRGLGVGLGPGSGLGDVLVSQLTTTPSPTFTGL
jgi:hypothetical protein